MQLSERWYYHIWPVDGMKFASLEANLGGGQGFRSLSHSSFLSLTLGAVPT